MATWPASKSSVPPPEESEVRALIDGRIADEIAALIGRLQPLVEELESIPGVTARIDVRVVVDIGPRRYVTMT